MMNRLGRSNPIKHQFYREGVYDLNTKATETIKHMRKIAKYNPDNYSHLIPMHRFDTENCYYVTCYNKKNQGYEVHWFDESSNDIGTTKWADISYIKNAEDAVKWTIGSLLISQIVNQIKTIEIIDFTVLIQGFDQVSEVRLT